MAQADETIEALVVRTIDYGEAHRIVHLMTDAGRVSVFAHGARASRRRFQGALEPFTSIRATLSRSRRGGSQQMSTLASATVENSRLCLRADLNKIALSSYVVELGERVAADGDASRTIYRLMVDALDHLASRPATVIVRRCFELMLIVDLGYGPHLDACVQCGRDSDRSFLDLQVGGLLCSDHRGDAQPVGTRTLEWMGRVLGAAPGTFEPNGALGDEWAQTAARKIGRATGSFFASLLDGPLRSEKLLSDLGL